MEVQRMEFALKRAITNISHDLRTPLTSAKGYLQMAENADLDKETQLRYFSIIRGRLDALTVLMDSLFAFSRAVEGDLTLSRLNIGNILRDTLVDNFAEIESKGFVVETDIPDAPVYCNCDENALKRVVQNLITNAIVHGKEYLRVRLLDGTIEIVNKADNLCDIDVHSIFERFYTADASRTGKRTGLGLAVVKELTEKMGGAISAAISDDMLIIRVYLTEKNKKENL
jgi:signal transduction histidine kinase